MRPKALTKTDPPAQAAVTLLTNALNSMEPAMTWCSYQGTILKVGCLDATLDQTIVAINLDATFSG